MAMMPLKQRVAMFQPPEVVVLVVSEPGQGHSLCRILLHLWSRRLSGPVTATFWQYKTEYYDVREPCTVYVPQIVKVTWWSLSYLDYRGASLQIQPRAVPLLENDVQTR